MAIQPIDLQTLFMRLGQVGRDQATAQEAIHQAQNVAGSEIAQRSTEAARTVIESEEVSDGPELVNDRDEASGGEHDHPSHAGDHRDKDDRRETFRDPDLGQIIDLTG